MTLLIHIWCAIALTIGFALGAILVWSATAEIRRYGHFHRNLDQNTAIESQTREQELEQTLAFVKNELMLELLKQEIADIQCGDSDFDDETPDSETAADPVPEDIFDEFDVDMAYAFRVDTDDPIIAEIHEPLPDVIPFRENP